MGRRTKIALPAFAAALVAAGAVLAGPGTVLTEQPVRAGAKNERAPAGKFDGRDRDNLTWVEVANVEPSRRFYNVFFQRSGGSKIKLNKTGQGYTGAVDPPWVVYQQMNRVRSESSVKLYRIDRRRWVDLPRVVNGPDWEFSPRIDGKWILFGRDDDESNVKRLILFNRTTRQNRVLVTLNGADNFLEPGQVNGKWAVWTICRGDVCDVYKYDIPARTRTKLPRPADPTGFAQYAAAVLANGVVYTTRSGDGCGVTVRIIRFRSGDPVTGAEIAVLPDGVDVSNGQARMRPNGSVDYLYDRVTCDSGVWDFYRVNDPPLP